MRTVNVLIWRNLSAHPLRSTLTALAITLGVGMTLAAAIVGQAASQSATQLSTAPQVDLEISSRDGVPFDQAVLDMLRAHPGVDLASPSLRVEVAGVRPVISRLTLLGVDPGTYQALHEIELAGGTFLNQPDTIVLPVLVAINHHLRVGDEVALRAGENAVTLTVAGRLPVEQDAILPQAGPSPLALVPLEVAQTFRVSENPRGLVDRVELKLRPGADVDRVKAELAAQLGSGLVVARATSGGGTNLGVVFVQLGLAMVGAIMLFAAAFVILNAFNMSVTGRTREIGAMRALGMMRRQVLRQVLAEAGLLSLLGAGLGLLVGVGLAWGALQVMGARDRGPLVVPGWGVALSLILGLGVTLAGALQPAWRASRVSPLVAVRAQVTRRESWYVRHGGRVGGVLLFLALPGVIATAFILRPNFYWSFALLGVGQAALLLATVLLLPALVKPFTSLCRPVLLRHLGTAGRLAADNLGRDKRRAVLTAGALTAALTTIIATSGLMTASLKGGLRGYLSLFNEDGMVIPDIAAMAASRELTMENVYEKVTTEALLDPAVIEAVEEVAASGAIEVERIGFAPIPSQVSPLLNSPGAFVEPELYLGLNNFNFFEGDPQMALEWMLRGRAMLLVPITAERLGVGVGDTVPVETLHGEVEFTVAGIGGNGFNFTVFPWADGESYFDLLGPSWLGLIVPEGEDVAEAVTQVQAAIAPFEGVTATEINTEALGGLFRLADRLQLLLSALLLLAVLVAGLGVVNTMVINVSERRREIGTLRAVGATQRQVRRAVVAEAAALGLMAALVATTLGLTMLALFIIVLTPGGSPSIGFLVGWDFVALVVPPALRDLGIAAALSLLLGPAVAALAAYYAARQAAATDVVSATRSERVTLKRTGPKRPERRRTPSRAWLWTLAWRELGGHRLRTTLSALAVALGVAMTVAADVIGGSVKSAVLQTEDVQTILVGLLDEFDRLLVIVGVMITAAAGFLVFNAFAMAITQRRQQIGALRALGLTRRQALRLVLAEGLIVGGLGTLLGLFSGPLLGRAVVTLLRSLDTAFNAFGQSSASLPTLLLAAGLGLGVTLISVLLPAWRATRISPLVALRSETRLLKETWFLGPALLGGLVVVALAVYLAVAPPGEWVLPPWDVYLTGLFTLAWLASLALLSPTLIGIAARLSRKLGGSGLRLNPKGRRSAVGRLLADNLARDRRRVTLTVATLAIGLAMIVSMTGFMTFWLDGLFLPTVDSVAEGEGWSIFAMDFMEGFAAYAGLESLQISPASIAAVREAVAGQAEVLDVHFVVVPELSFLGSSYFSMVLDPHVLRRSENAVFTFSEGDWDSAMPILEAGCGLLVTPLVARNNGVGLGDTLIVQGANGPVVCTVAGLGSPLVYASIISGAAGEAFGIGEPFGLYVFPLPGVDPAQLTATMEDLRGRYPDVWPNKIQALAAYQYESIDMIKSLLNGLLLLAILAAALGVVNTTVMSVAERRRELGLLRAVGATRRQVNVIVAGEAALMGLLGGGLGLVAGAGFTVILAVVYGGNAVGIPDLPLWSTAWGAVQPAALNGLLGLLAAPWICAGAAWLPARSLLRGPAVETLQAARQEPVSPRRVAVGLFRWGSIRVRFVLGSGALMLAVLAALIWVVTRHERDFLETQMRDMLAAMIRGQASLVELNLPDDAQTLDLSDLQMGPSGANTNLFDAENILRFRALVDDMSAFGLLSFAIADRDDVALLSLDPRELGARLPELATPDEVTVTSTREAGGGRQMRAWAPVHNADGLVVGSVRMTIDLAEAERFWAETRAALWAVGGLIVAAGLALSWALATPLAVATGRLSAHAARVARGEYALFDSGRRSRWSALVARTSLRTRLTAALVLVVVLLVVALESVVLPIERHHTERELKDGMLSAAEWMGQVVSEGLAMELSFDSAQDGPLTLDQMLSASGTFDWTMLQELSEQTRSQDLAYAAVVDGDGLILLADQLSLVGAEVPLPVETQVEQERWRDEDIWVISTPLRQGRDGSHVGALRIGVRRAGVEAFLDESRLLFRLAVLVAVLASVLLAQGVGGAVTVPVRELATGTRRVARGDLDVQFHIGTRDELALLATAFNQMVAGLREREWLRDMFGRFVSHEVAEAIRTGQVRLEGENRVVSVLFCDIRGFTARSEKSTPEQVVALLNEYLPVVVEAAQAHGGTVNKFGGDSTLVIYGAPNVVQESAYQAVLTALQMRANLRALNEKLAGRGEEPIRIGVGINTGVALAGAVGPSERQEYTVIGDTVNLASRIEALNKTYPNHDVLISDWTYEALGARRAEFECVDLGEVPIRGKEEPVRVWAVVKCRA